MVSDQPGTASQPTRYTRSTRQLRHAGTWSRGRRRRRRVRLCSDQSHRGVLAWLLGFSIAGIVSVAEHGERDHRPNGAMGVLATVLPNGTVDSPPFVKGLSIGNFGSFGGEIWIEIGLVGEHGTSDSEDPVSDRTEGRRHDRGLGSEERRI
jgi:hypothetical protein